VVRSHEEGGTVGSKGRSVAHPSSTEKEEVVITRHGKPAGVLIGFKSEDDWFEYRLQNDARFLNRVEAARRSLKAGHGIRIEDLEK
jgi:prevent-host-death family protein